MRKPKSNRICRQCGERKQTEVIKEDYICSSCLNDIGRILRSKNRKIDRYITNNRILEGKLYLLQITKCPLCKILYWLRNKHDNC